MDIMIDREREVGEHWIENQEEREIGGVLRQGMMMMMMDQCGWTY